MNEPANNVAAGHSPVVPAYGRSTLADVFPSLAARLGLPGLVDVVGLPSARRFVVVLVDGLGHRLLQRHLFEVPYLADLFGDAVPLTSGAPSTTATSITSLGTGVAPGVHGIAGYTFRLPGADLRMNALTWDNGPGDVETFQASATLFEQLSDAGVFCTSVGLPRFRGSGLTRAALRGASFVGVDDADEEARLQAIAGAATASERTAVYVYERRLDHVGHGKGTDSPAWRATLRRIDAFLEQLRDRLPDDVALLVTGDHGMVDVPGETRVVADETSGLLDGVDLLAGEARFRQLYSTTPDAVAARWADELGERAWVRTREQAASEGWFGDLRAANAARFGDVLVAMRGTWAMMSRDFPQEFTLVGMHGSLTRDETDVPLLADHPASDDFAAHG